MWISVAAVAQRRYPLSYHWQDTVPGKPAPTASFTDRASARHYLDQLPALLSARGYWAAAVDSVQLDSLSGKAWVYLGPSFSWSEITLDSTARQWSGFLNTGRGKGRNSRAPEQRAPAEVPRQLLDYLQNNGYPFAEVHWDSVQFSGSQVSARLKLNTGPLYRIDSVMQKGKARLRAKYLHNYLHLPKGMPYSQALLDDVDRRLEELPFVSQSRPWELQMLGSGGIVDVYLEPRRSNILNILVGVMPSSTQTPDQQLQVTGDVNILLRNAFGGGETLGINWQQIQYKSPRLRLAYQHPYALGANAGVDFAFDLLRKDTQFLNIEMLAGIPFEIDARRTAKVFYRLQQTMVSYIDTAMVMATQTLPDLADVSHNNLGIDFALNTTDFSINPRKGGHFHLLAYGGVKKVKPSSTIENLKDPANPDFDYGSLYDSVLLNTYLIKASLNGAKYLPTGGNTVLKIGLQGGWLQSASFYRNELFQIGGSKLLRGFDEESIYARGYGVATTEFRLLASRASYFYAFADLGWAQYKDQTQTFDYSYLGTGIGMAIQAGNSQVNISWAAGKRNDLPFDLRQSKIHLGFVNFF